MYIHKCYIYTTKDSKLTSRIFVPGGLDCYFRGDLRVFGRRIGKGFSRSIHHTSLNPRFQDSEYSNGGYIHGAYEEEEL